MEGLHGFTAAKSSADHTNASRDWGANAILTTGRAKPFVQVRNSEVVPLPMLPEQLAAPRQARTMAN